VWCGAALALVVAACSGREGRAAQAALSERPLAPIDWKQVDAALGKAGSLQPDGAYKAGLPRGDLHVTAAGVAVKPALALGSCGIDTAQVAQILGSHGKVNGGVYQVGVPRAEQVTADGVEVPPSMGLATAINFQPTGAGKAAITGDFVLLGSEVNPVIRALHDNGIAVTALHSHMLADSPHFFFMHYWANDDALKLA